MTFDDALKVLARAASVGLVAKPANPAEARLTAQTWHDALDDDLTLADADAIVVGMAANNEDRRFIIPGQVNAAWRSHKRREHERRHNELLSSTSALARDFAVPMPDQLRDQFYDRDAHLRKLAQSVDCPYRPCRAKAGKPCTSFDGGPLTKSVAHPSRLDLARQGVSA